MTTSHRWTWLSCYDCNVSKELRRLGSPDSGVDGAKLSVLRTE